MRLDELFSVAYKTNELPKAFKPTGITVKHWFDGPVEHATYDGVEIIIDHETREDKLDVRIKKNGKLICAISVDSYDEIPAYLEKHHLL